MFESGTEPSDVNTLSNSRNKSKLGYVLAGVTGGAAIALSAICAPFVLPALRRICLPYVPATTAQVNNVFEALKGRSGLLVDLGSGDGRIVLEAARNGFKAKGVELNPWLVLYSRVLAYKELKQGFISKSLYPSFHRTDLWKFDLSQFRNIVIFGVEEMMPDLEEKLGRELSENGAVVACRFPLPNWTPSTTIGAGIDTVWLYKRSVKKNN